MRESQLRKLLEAVKDGSVDPDQALQQLEHLPFEDLGFAKVDHHRALRHGMPEVVLGRGKTVEEVVEISKRLLEQSENLLITRAGEEMAAAVKKPEQRCGIFSALGSDPGLG